MRNILRKWYGLDYSPRLNPWLQWSELLMMSYLRHTEFVPADDIFSGCKFNRSWFKWTNYLGVENVEIRSKELSPSTEIDCGWLQLGVVGLNYDCNGKIGLLRLITVMVVTRINCVHSRGQMQWQSQWYSGCSDVLVVDTGWLRMTTVLQFTWL